MIRITAILATCIALGACSALPKLEPDAGRRAGDALQAALAAYCRLAEGDRQALRRALAVRHGVELPSAIACRIETTPSESGRSERP